MVRSLLEPTDREAAREAALQVLEASGLVKEIKRTPMAARPERPLIPIQGKPLSETIIEERR